MPLSSSPAMSVGCWSRSAAVPTGGGASGNTGTASSSGHRRHIPGRSSANAVSETAMHSGSGSSRRAGRTRGFSGRSKSGRQHAVSIVKRQSDPMSGIMGNMAKTMTQPAQERTDAEWREELTDEQYAVCRCSATEPPFTGKYWNHKEAGLYRCVACGAALFESEAKYDSGSGWPSFHAPVALEAVSEHEDLSHGMRRIEIGR